MSEAPQIAGLGQDDQRRDRTDPRDCANALIVWMLREQRVGFSFRIRSNLTQLQITRQL